jgi:V8-like Glu-specific endopeptidase
VYVALGRAEPASHSTVETPGRPTPMALTRVHDTTTREFRCVCRVVVKTDDGHSIGSGVLIGPRHVLTCAHVIFPPQNPRVTAIVVHAAPNGPDDTTRGIAANGWAVNPAWRASDCRTADEDVGIIRLSKPITTGFWPVERFSPARLAQAAAYLAGYPSRSDDPEARFMYRSRGRIDGAIRIDSCSAGRLAGRLLPSIDDTTRLVAHALDTAPSMSGGPLWTYIDGRRVLWGLHAGNVDDGRRKKALLLNAAVRALIGRWMSTGLPAPA